MFLDLNVMCEENTLFMRVLRVTLYVKYFNICMFVCTYIHLKSLLKLKGYAR